MPTYIFENQETGEIVEKRMPVSESTDSFEEGGVEFKRRFDLQLKSMNINRNAAKSNSLWPKKSTSCGIPKSEVAEDGHYKDPKKRKRFPKHKFDKKGRMKFDSRRQMKQHTKDIGMEPQ